MEKHRYFTWDSFTENFGQEMLCSTDIFQNMKKNGLDDFSLAAFDFHFLSNDKKKLLSLKKFLTDVLKYNTDKIVKFEGAFDLSGITNPFPISEENLMCWALHMYKLGYEFDCVFDAYGAEWNPNDQTLQDLSKNKEDEYFEKAIKCYEAKDLSGAVFNFSSVLKINPNEVNAYYSRAIIKNELYIWKAALKDYDAAIDLAPDFVDAIINRGAIKDENEDYTGAIADYDTAIELSPQNGMAFFNRGNSKYNTGDNEGALKDWEMAKQLGADYAEKRIMEFKNNS